MSRPKKIAILIGTMLLLGSGEATAEPLPLPPHVVVTTPNTTINVPNGNTYALPVGSHILDGTSFQNLDEKLKEQETLVIRYKAENESLKKSLDSWSPGWGSLIVLTGLAITTGAVVYFVN